MLSRVAVFLLLAGILPVVGQSQENNEAVLGSIRDNLSLMACGADGRTYFARVDRDHSAGTISGHSVLEVSRDGSIVTFQFSNGAVPVVAAFDVSGVTVIAVSRSHVPHERGGYEIYQLDNQASSLGQYPVAIDFFPIQMAVLRSGKTIVVGHPEASSWSHRREWTYVGAVLDADGRMVTRFDFPPPPEGGKWTFPRRYQMVAGDGVAYIVLETDSESEVGIAKISEAGGVDIKVIPEPPQDDERIHRVWLLCPSVAVEEYNYVGKRPFRMYYDEYDVSSGEKIATKVSPGGSAQCYFGAEVGWTSIGGQVDPSRHLSPDTLRLSFSKLENQAASSPPVQH